MVDRSGKVCYTLRKGRTGSGFPEREEAHWARKQRRSSWKSMMMYLSTFLTIFCLRGEVLKSRTLTPLPGEGVVRDHDGKSRQRFEMSIQAAGDAVGRYWGSV